MKKKYHHLTFVQYKKLQKKVNKRKKIKILDPIGSKTQYCLMGPDPTQQHFLIKK
jgi:hypothetical protein